MEENQSPWPINLTCPECHDVNSTVMSYDVIDVMASPYIRKPWKSDLSRSICTPISSWSPYIKLWCHMMSWHQPIDYDFIQGYWNQKTMEITFFLTSWPWPMTLTTNLGLDLIQVNMHTNFEVPTMSSNGSAMRLLNNRRTHTEKHRRDWFYYLDWTCNHFERPFRWMLPD